MLCYQVIVMASRSWFIIQCISIMPHLQTFLDVEHDDESVTIHVLVTRYGCHFHVHFAYPPPNHLTRSGGFMGCICKGILWHHLGGALG